MSEMSLAADKRTLTVPFKCNTAQFQHAAATIPCLLAAPLCEDPSWNPLMIMLLRPEGDYS